MQIADKVYYGYVIFAIRKIYDFGIFSYKIKKYILLYQWEPESPTEIKAADGLQKCVREFLSCKKHDAHFAARRSGYSWRAFKDDKCLFAGLEFTFAIVYNAHDIVQYYARCICRRIAVQTFRTQF